MKRINLILILLFIAVISSQATVINVPEDHDTIQAAIGSSEDGDTVQVAPGEYSENINLSGRDISLLGSLLNPAETIIAAEENGSVITYSRGESRESRLSGFTLTGGTGNAVDDEHYGGGIFIIESSPSIDHCIIGENHVNGGGGAIACLAADPRFDFCVIYSNSAELFGGAVLCDWESSPEFWDCTFTDNQAENRGGGLFVQHGSRALIISTILWGNAPQEIYLGADNGNIVVISFSTVMDGRDGIVVGDGDRAMWGAGAIDGDPLFIDPDNDDFRPGWASFPIFDEEKSPCIDRAHNQSPFDPDNTRSDIGALYFDQGEPSVIFFEPDNLIIDDPGEFVINITAEGDRGLNWQISPDVEWLTVEPAEGSLYPDQDVDVFISLHEEQLERGRYNTDLIFRADNPINREFVVELIFYYLGGSPPRWVEIPEEIAAVESDQLIFDIEGMDPGEEEISIRMRRGNLPRPAQLNDNGDGTATFSWDISHFDAGLYSPEFILTDGVYSLTAEIPIAVEDYMTKFNLDSPPDGSELDDSPDVNFRWNSASRQPDNDDISYSLKLWLPDSTEIVLQAADTSITIGREFISPNHDINIDIRWEVWAHDGFDSLRCTESFVFILPPLGVPSDQNLTSPGSILIEGFYPNPFNSSSVVSFFVPAVTELAISLLSVDGKLISQLHSGIYQAGAHSLLLEGGNLAAGVYFIRLRAEIKILHKKIVLLK